MRTSEDEKVVAIAKILSSDDSDEGNVDVLNGDNVQEVESTSETQEEN